MKGVSYETDQTWRPLAEWRRLMSSSNSRLRRPLRKQEVWGLDYIKVRQRPLPGTTRGSFIRIGERTQIIGGREDKAVIYQDDQYAVAVYEPDDSGFTCLTVQRIDRQPARDWRDLQRIKTDLIGAEREAYEVFPAESRVVDTTNTTWLWALPAGQHISQPWSRLVMDGREQ